MVRILYTKISAPCFYGLWCIYLQKSAHPVLWIPVRIFKKISAPCMDYGAYIYKNQMLPISWIMVHIFIKISAPCFMDYGAYIFKNHCTLFYGL
jgi:hypothetical protein